MIIADRMGAAASCGHQYGSVTAALLAGVSRDYISLQLQQHDGEDPWVAAGFAKLSVLEQLKVLTNGDHAKMVLKISDNDVMHFSQSPKYDFMLCLARLWM